MKMIRPPVAVLVSLLVSAPPAALAQMQPGAPAPAASRFELPHAGGPWFLRPYRRAEVPPVRLENSNRLESLLRAGILYLSLEDAIAIALENAWTWRSPATRR